MGEPKVGKSKNGEVMHYSVGAIIYRDGKFLLVDRLKPPLGWAAVAGHIDEGEGPEEALQREIFEESGLEMVFRELIFEEEVDENACSRGVGVHYWYVYKVGVKGEPVFNPNEAKAMGWFTKEEIEKLSLETVWRYWLGKLWSN